MSYKVAAPDEYLAITGMGIENVRITKSAWVFPFQRCTRFSVQPEDYVMELLAMTKEKLKFTLPVAFTVGPDVNNRGANTTVAALAAAAGEDGEDNAREDRGDALLKYAMLLSQGGDDDKHRRQERREHVNSIVRGIIEGETRVLVSSMTMEELFTEREVFKKRIYRNIQGELAQFGLRIWNANVKELKDAPDSVYFASLSRKAHEGATNQARIDVADAQFKGNVGESRRKGEEQREIAKIDAETAVMKTDRDIERAKAEAHLATQKTAFNRDVALAKVAAERNLQATDEDLKKDVEIKRAGAELERLRATDLVKATIAKESTQQAADAAAYQVSADARAQQEARQRDADAAAYRVRLEAEAEAFATQQSADAEIFRRLKEAEATAAMAEAYTKMSGAFGGPSGLIQYLMIEKGTYVELAKANAAAIRGLEPKISVWNTGSAAGSGSGGDSTEAMRNIYQMLPPLMTTINEQTGITLPEWQFGKLNAAQQAMKQEQAKTNGRG